MSEILGVHQQRLDRPEPLDVVHQLGDHLLTLEGAEVRRRSACSVSRNASSCTARALVVEFGDLRHVHRSGPRRDALSRNDVRRRSHRYPARRRGDPFAGTAATATPEQEQVAAAGRPRRHRRGDRVDRTRGRASRSGTPFSRPPPPTASASAVFGDEACQPARRSGQFVQRFAEAVAEADPGRRPQSDSSGTLASNGNTTSNACCAGSRFPAAYLRDLGTSEAAAYRLRTRDEGPMEARTPMPARARAPTVGRRRPWAQRPEPGHRSPAGPRSARRASGSTSTRCDRRQRVASNCRTPLSEAGGGRMGFHR